MEPAQPPLEASPEPMLNVTGAGDASQDEGSSRLGRALLGAALLLGLLRFVRLGEWSLWSDEVLTWGDSHYSPGGLLNRAGYWLILQTVELLGGEPTEFNLRLLPAIAGYLAIPLSFWAFRPIAGSTRAGMAAILIAVSAWELQWSQTARFYTLVQLTSLLGAGVMIRGSLRGRWLQITSGVLLAGVGVVFHLQAGVAAAALLAAAVMAPPSSASGAGRAGRRAALALLVPALAASPLLYSAVSSYAAKKAVGDAVGSALHFILSSGWYVTPALGAAAVGAAIVFLRRGDPQARFVLAVVTAGGLALLCFSAVATVTAQYFFALFPFVALVASWPVGARGLREFRGGTSALVAVLIIPQLAGSALYLSSERGQRPRWREAVELVSSRRQPGEAVASDPATVVEFYLGDRDPRRVREPSDTVHFDRFNPWMLRKLVRSGESVWAVIRNDTLMTYDPKVRAEFRTFITKNFRLVRQFPVLVQGRDLSIDVWYHP